jgi:hypothetical protein
MEKMFKITLNELRLREHVVFTLTTLSTFKVQVVDNVKNCKISSKQKTLWDGLIMSFPQQFHEPTYLKTVGIQAQNIETITQTPCTIKNCINTKKPSKHKHTMTSMFWNLKSPKRDLRSQNLGFILNPQISLNLFTLELFHN